MPRLISQNGTYGTRPQGEEVINPLALNASIDDLQPAAETLLDHRAKQVPAGKKGTGGAKRGRHRHERNADGEAKEIPGRQR